MGLNAQAPLGKRISVHGQPRLATLLPRSRRQRSFDGAVDSFRTLSISSIIESHFPEERHPTWVAMQIAQEQVPFHLTQLRGMLLVRTL